jgi:hypothetical protein
VNILWGIPVILIVIIAIIAGWRPWKNWTGEGFTFWGCFTKALALVILLFLTSCCMVMYSCGKKVTQVSTAGYEKAMRQEAEDKMDSPSQEYQGTGHGTATKSQCVKAWFWPGVTWTKIIKGSGARYVFLRDPSITHEDMAGRPSPRWPQMPRGRYAVYPLDGEEFVELEWGQLNAPKKEAEKSK